MATILVVDDRALNRQFLITLLGYEGHRVLESVHPTEALEMMRAEPPDLVITDIVMPEIDGFEFIRLLRDDPTLADIPIILYTALYSEEEAHILARRCGVHHVITKPSNPSTVINTVMQALRERLSGDGTGREEELTRDHRRLLSEKMVKHIDQLEAMSLRLTALINLGQELVCEKDAVRLIERVCHAAMGILGSHGAAAGILTADGSSLQCLFAAGNATDAPQDNSAPASHAGLLSSLVADRSPRRLRCGTTVSEHLGLPFAYDPNHSLLGIPIMTPTKVYGWLCVLDKASGLEFTDDDERLALALAAQVGLAYENAHHRQELACRSAQLEEELFYRTKTQEHLQLLTQQLQTRVDERTFQLKTATDKLTAWVNENEQCNRDRDLLRDCEDLLQGCLTEHELYGIVTRLGPNVFHSSSGALCVFNEGRTLLTKAAGWGDTMLGDNSYSPTDCWAIRRGRLHLVGNHESGLLCTHMAGSEGSAQMSGYFCAPVMAMGETLGALHVFVKPSTTEQWGDSVNRLAMPVARLIGSALSGVLLREFFRSQAIRDPLTGLFNRRYMQESLEREAHRSIRHGQSIGIVMLDIDHFKRTNDHFGHEMGDALLAALGRLLKERTRTEDIACRYGGEEFLLILPGAGLEITRQRAEQLREQAKTLRVELRGQVFQGMTVSMGIAAFPEHGTTVEDVLRAADKALYEAKTEGRDRVALAHNDAYGKG